MSMNVRGLRKETKRKAIFRHCHKNYRDSIVFLQETHSCLLDEKKWKNEWGGEVIFNHFETSSR